MSKLWKTLAILKESKSEQIKPDKGLGIITNKWLWLQKMPPAVESYAKQENTIKPKAAKSAFESWSKRFAHAKKPRQNEEASEENAGNTSQPIAATGEDAARKIIIDNPDVSAATLLNTMKSQGLEIVKQEADTSSSNGQALRSGVEEGGPGSGRRPDGGGNGSVVVKDDSSKKGFGKVTVIDTSPKPIQIAKPMMQSNSITFNARFLESAARNDAIGWTRFRCVLIEEGLGNLRDAYYYSKEALESCVNLFEGKKIYADHPSMVDDEIRPERSVKDILGHFENVALVENEGRHCLEADVVIMPDEPYRWARGLLRSAVEYAKKFPDKSFVGLSINASGSAEPKDLNEVLREAPESARLKLQRAQEEIGLTEVKYVSRIDDAVSCDLVTEAGAGGKVLTLIEQEKSLMKKKNMKESEETQEKKEAQGETHPAGTAENEAAPADELGQPEHSDAAQDIELIKKMIAKYMGGSEDAELDEESMEMAMEAYECYKEMGQEGDKAVERACEAVKLAKHMAQKQAQKEAAPAGEEPEKKEEPVEEAKKESDVQESEKVVALTGKVALLEAQVKKFQLRDHLEKVCMESGLPQSVTKKFKSLEEVTSAKNETEIDKLFKLFKEGQGAGGKANVFDFSITTEKTTMKENNKTKAIDLSDCLN